MNFLKIKEWIDNIEIPYEGEFYQTFLFNSILKEKYK